MATNSFMNQVNADLSNEFCSRCGWPVGRDFAFQATEDDKIAFLDCLLAGKPWTKQYSLFNDLGTVEFRTRSMIEQRCVEQALGPVMDMLNPEQLRLYYRYAMVYSFIHIKLKDTVIANQLQPNTKINGAEEFENEIEKVFGQLNNSIYDAIRVEFTTFEATSQTLTARADDENFWKQSQEQKKS